MVPDTLYLAVHILDRYLSIKVVSREHLQLVGITSLMIASKYEEQRSSLLDKFSLLSDGLYSIDHLKTKEIEILSALNYELGCPNPLLFLNCFIHSENPFLLAIAKYAMEMCLLDSQFIGVLPSKVSAACVLFTLILCGNQLWVYFLFNFRKLDNPKVIKIMN
jgi:hypothetical protein